MYFAVGACSRSLGFFTPAVSCGYLPFLLLRFARWCSWVRDIVAIIITPYFIPYFAYCASFGFAVTGTGRPGVFVTSAPKAF